MTVVEVLLFLKLLLASILSSTCIATGACNAAHGGNVAAFFVAALFLKPPPFRSAIVIVVIVAGAGDAAFITAEEVSTHCFAWVNDGAFDWISALAFSICSLREWMQVNGATAALP